MYLNHVARLIKEFPEKVVKFNTITGSPGILHKRYEEYNSFVVFDYDFDDTAFHKNIALCDKLGAKLKPGRNKKGHIVSHAYSNVNFDLWLILHKREYNKPIIGK